MRTDQQTFHRPDLMDETPGGEKVARERTRDEYNAVWLNSVLHITLIFGTMAETKLSVNKMNPLLVVAYATILITWGVSQVFLIPYVVHLLVLVTAILYAACHRSLNLLEEPLKEGEEGYDPDAPGRDTMRQEDAYQFPIIGSVSLFSLYLAFKYLGQDLVNLLIGAYFGAVGCGALTMTLSPLLTSVAPSSMSQSNLGWKKSVKHPLPEWILESPLDLGLKFSGAGLLAFGLSVGVIYIYFFQGKHWTLNNVLGICFCIQGIERFSLGTYKIGAILLTGLFFYDIFWVFGTDVMVTVAKGLEGPIKLLFPRSLIPHEETGKIDLSLLGLGDIVIPGFFLALLLRFDAHNAKVGTVKINIHESFPKPYFHSALIAYVLGLMTTLYIMIRFNAAQPALLYLVPACLGSSFLCAVVRGEVKELLDYSEEEEEEEEKPAAPEETKKDK
jgi:minor histocompatibility antigen H13